MGTAAGRELSINAILFDLDDTLVVEQAAAERALRSDGPTGEDQGWDRAGSTRGGGTPSRPGALAAIRDDRILQIRRHQLVGRSVGTIRATGSGDGKAAKLRSTYRRESWSRALRAQGVNDAALAQELADAFQHMRRTIHEPFSAALPTLSDLRGDYRLGLVTNGVPDLQR